MQRLDRIATAIVLLLGVGHVVATPPQAFVATAAVLIVTVASALGGRKSVAVAP